MIVSNQSPPVIIAVLQVFDDQTVQTLPLDSFGFRNDEDIVKAGFYSQILIWNNPG